MVKDIFQLREEFGRFIGTSILETQIGNSVVEKRFLIKYLQLTASEVSNGTFDGELEKNALQAQYGEYFCFAAARDIFSKAIYIKHVLIEVSKGFKGVFDPYTMRYYHGRHAHFGAAANALGYNSPAAMARAYSRGELTAEVMNEELGKLVVISGSFSRVQETVDYYLDSVLGPTRTKTL